MRRINQGFLMLAFVLLSWAARAQAPADPEILLRQGRMLIENNCGDCMGSTNEGMLKGIKKVERALELGSPDRLEAYRLLAYGWGQMAHVYLKWDSPEYRSALKRQQEAFEKALELAPRDVDILFDYSLTVRDDSALAEILRRILELEPEHIGGLFHLGQIEVEQGDPKGLARMQRAFEMSELEQAVGYGQILVGTLREVGKDKEADELEREVEKIRRELRGGH